MLTMPNNMLGRPGEDLLGIVEDFVTKLRNGTITSGQAKKFLRKEDPWVCPMDIESQLTRVLSLYAEAFGLTLDPASVPIPARSPGFDRLIVVPQGITLGKVVAYLRTKFEVSLYTEDLDQDVEKNDRTNTTTYAIWVRDVVEADEELANLSANDLTAQKISSETLLERLLHGLLYFTENGKHLDVKNVTLCAGSRTAGGDVSRVYWYAGLHRLHVSWYCPGCRDVYLRARAVVSLPAAKRAG